MSVEGYFRYVFNKIIRGYSTYRPISITITWPITKFVTRRKTPFPIFYRAQTFPSLLFYLQTWCSRLCWYLQYAGHVSYYLRNRPRSPWSLCVETKGLRFNSSRGLRIFFFVSRSWRNVKNLSIFLYRAQNLPSLFFYWKKYFWGNWTGTLNTVDVRGKPWPYFIFTWT